MHSDGGAVYITYFSYPPKLEREIEAAVEEEEESSDEENEMLDEENEMLNDEEDEREEDEALDPMLLEPEGFYGGT